jgi:hypothetical protein
VKFVFLVLCVVFCRSLYVHLTFFVWPLCCLSFDLRILITPLVSSNTSYSKNIQLLSVCSYAPVYMNLVCLLLNSFIQWPLVTQLYVYLEWIKYWIVNRLFYFFCLDRCLYIWPFSFDHCVVCPSIYGFLLWFLQTLPIPKTYIIRNSICKQEDTEVWYLNHVYLEIENIIIPLQLQFSGAVE